MRAYKKSYSLMLVPIIMILLFASVSSVAYACEEDIKLVITSPVDEVHTITTTPKMPTIDLKAELIGAKAVPHTFEWRATLSYSWKDRNLGPQTETFLLEETTTGDLDTSWTPDFSKAIDIDKNGEVLGDNVMGGDLVVEVYTKLDAYSEYTDKKTFKIKGENPNPDDIKLELGGAEGVEYQVLAFIESHFQQFSTDPKYNRVGEPFFGAPSGYGVMQLDPVSGRNQKPYVLLWNWRENIKAGKDHFNSNKAEAGLLPTRVQDKKVGEDYGLGYVPPTISFPGDISGISELTSDQNLTQAFYSYNAGDVLWNGQWHAYYIWYTKEGRWDSNLDWWKKHKEDRPYIAPSASATAYADDAMDIYHDVRKGGPVKTKYEKQYGKWGNIV